MKTTEYTVPEMIETRAVLEKILREGAGENELAVRRLISELDAEIERRFSERNKDA